jgi:predicted regulator of Ras-like GTPase activity (Roadblock/LC7/MglB family)
MQVLEPVPDPSSRFREIQHILDELCAAHHVMAAVLVGEEGLAVAAAFRTDDGGDDLAALAAAVGDPTSVAAAQNPDVIAAVMAHMWSAGRMGRRQLRWPDIDEMTVMVQRGLRLAGRALTLGDETFILAVLIPYWMSYHKAVAQARERIRRAWSPDLAA